jgi:hypothetical protein
VITPARITSLDDPALGRLFTGVRRSWFRLETLQHYEVDYEREEFAAFLHGEHPGIVPGPWEEMIASHAAAGRRLSRVHVITEPVSDYIRYELAYYEISAAAGEDVRLIPVPEGEWPSGVPQADFWLFDERDVWVMAYDEEGRFLFAEQRRRDRRKAIRYRDAAMAQSVPLADYAELMRHR